MKRVVFLLMILVLAACGDEDSSSESNNSKEPPELVVSASGNELVALLGEYSWSYDNFDGTISNVSVDIDIPPRIAQDQTEHLNTELGAEVNLSFAKPPQEVRADIWNNSQVEREIEVEDLAFKTDEAGNILYEIIAKWEQGTVHYVVKINVQ